MRHVWPMIIIFLVAVDGRAAALLSIDDAVREALANNPKVHRQQAYHDAAIFEKNAARADFFPRLSADYTYQNLAEAPFVNIYGNQVITNSRDQHHWNLTVRQPLFSGFSIRARHRLAELGVANRELELHQTRQTLVLQVKQRCFELLMAEKTLEVAKRSTAALSAHEADVRMFHNNGLVSMNDLLKAQVARAEAVQQQHRAEAGRDQARAALSLLLGRDYNSDIAVADLVVTHPDLPELSTMIDQALMDRPEIALLQQSIRSTSEELVVARSDYYPHIDAMGRYQQDGDDPGARNNAYTNQYNASVGIEARWTLFEFGKTRAAAAAAVARQRAMEQTLEGMRDEVRLQVVQAHLDLDVAARNIDTAKTALEQAREHWRITNLLYQQQLTTSTEVLDARSYHDRAQSAYHDAHYGYGAAMAGLAWAVGAEK